jgi:hypothetical protein
LPVFVLAHPVNATITFFAPRLFADFAGRFSCSTWQADVEQDYVGPERRAAATASRPS